LSKEQPTVEQIDEMVVPDTPKYENIVVDMSGCSTPKSTPELGPNSFDHPTQNSMPIVILTIKFKGMEIMLSHLCINDMKDITVYQYRLPGKIVVVLMNGHGRIYPDA
jgi:hypothetical protein